MILGEIYRIGGWARRWGARIVGGFVAWLDALWWCKWEGDVVLKVGLCLSAHKTWR